MSTPAPTVAPVTLSPERLEAARAQAEKIAAAVVQNALIDELARALAVNEVLVERLTPPSAVDHDAPSLND